MTDPLKVTRRQYERLIEATAFLEWELRGRAATQDFEADSGEILLAFDSNVIQSYAAPFSQGRLSRGRRGFGQFFPRRFEVSPFIDASLRNRVLMIQQAEDRTAGRTLRGLTTFALDKYLNESQPLLQFKAHASETRAHHRALMKRVFGTSISIKARRDALHLASRKALGLFLNRSKEGLAPDHYLDITQDILARIEEVRDYNPEQQLSRFTELVGQQQSQVEEVEEKSFGQWPSNRPDYKLAEFILHRGFDDALASHRTGKSRLNDIDVLTTLLLANRYQVEMRDHTSGNGIRIVLVTCDKELSIAGHSIGGVIARNLDNYIKEYFVLKRHETPDAMSVYRAKEKMEDFFDLSDRRRNREPWIGMVSLYYIRHISGYLGNFVDQPKGRTGRSEADDGDLFEAVFLRSFDYRELPLHHLKSIILNSSAEVVLPLGFGEAFNDLLNRWKAFISHSIGMTDTESTISKEQKEVLVSLFHKKSEPGEPEEAVKVDALSGLLVDYVERSRDRMVLQFSSHGTELASFVGQTSSRTPPNLYFRSLPHCLSMICRLACDPRYPGSRAWSEDFKNIGEQDCSRDTTDDRWESHLKFLILAASSAALERWSIARRQVQRALDILERSRTHGLPPPITGGASLPDGRESNFLLSVCERMLADDKVGLEKARDAYERSRDLNEATRADGERATSMRYLNEDLSLALARYYILRRDNDRNPDIDIDAAFQNCKADRDSLLLKFKSLQSHADYKQLTDNIPTPLGQLSDADYMQAVTLVSVATNIVQLAVIDSFWRTKNYEGIFVAGNERLKTGLARDGLPAARDYLEAVANDGRWIEASVTRLYKEVARLMLRDGNPEDDIQSTPRTKTFEAIFRKGRPPEMSDMERWRYAALRDFIEDLDE